MGKKIAYQCEDCDTDLLEIGEEIYCPRCEVGILVENDGLGDVDQCKGCPIKLATSYPYDLCPSCFPGDLSVKGALLN